MKFDILKNGLIIASALSIGFFTNLYSQDNQDNMDQGFDTKTKPAPLEDVEFSFPEYKQMKLDNGLTLFAIEDSEAPIVEFRLLLPGGSSYDSYPGQSDALSALLTKGYGNLNARDFAEKLDGLGISIGANSGQEGFSISGASLESHQDVMWDALKGILTEPLFPKDELEKLKPQFLASIQSDKGSPGSMASKLIRKVIYGNDHPFARFMSESDIEKMSISSIKEYFSNYIIPDNGSILVVGDIKASEIKKKLNSLLSGWKMTGKKLNPIPDPEPQPMGVYYISRPGSVQSSVRIVAPAPEYSDPEREKLHLTSGIISGGFSGRLFKTLREKYSYTYSPTGTLTSYATGNFIMAGSDVRSAVTDSSIIVIRDQLNDLAQNGPTEEELQIMKKYQIGNYNMSFEDPSFAGYVIQNAFFKGQPLDYAKDFTKRKMMMTSSDVKKSVRKYFNPTNAYTIVVGDPSVRESLEQFGMIFDYTTDIKPTTGEGSVMKKINDSPMDIIEDYREAIGGSDLRKVETLQSLSQVKFNMQGQEFPGEQRSIQTREGKFFVDLTIPNVVSRRLVWDGTNMLSINNGTPMPIIGPDRDATVIEESIFYVANLQEGQLPMETLGSQNGSRIINITLPNKVQTLYFDENTDLLTKKTEEIEAPTGKMLVEYTYSDYKKVKVGNIELNLPHSAKVSSPMFSNSASMNYSINEPYDSNLMKTK
ncbi:MAG: hypothetical protein Kapaf2KO_00080 [Candidatus Kapaibacteriales bacterium]